MPSPSSHPKPALVIVPGACHHPSHYAGLSSRLAAAGYESTTVDLPSTGGGGDEKPVQTLNPDIETIQHAIRSQLSRGRNVVLIMHSFGGITGSAAVQGFLRPTQHEGDFGVGVVKLIYLAGIICEPGRTVLEQGGGAHPPLVHFPLPDPKDAGWLTFHNPAQTFYAECAPDVQEASVARLRLFSEAPGHDIVPYSGWKDVDSYYLLCGKDQVLPVSVQQAWISNPSGRWKRVERLETDHSPFLSPPDETAGFVVRCLEDGS
ncbi:hypothetical protein B0A55_04189 [Friedmanniomyces simplex]|uniref:AB hydrolase-1 domain-containing protein n=1 Tax=Friedmanniomyces simplex TaxID=329884 RepID=A0A4U0XJF3_9PEZI|nr:hypothetical protein B0A55_04189 [Friedmanniomyces simplex]